MVEVPSAKTLDELVSACQSDYCFTHFIIPKDAIEKAYDLLHEVHVNPEAKNIGDALGELRSYLRELAESAVGKDVFPNKYAHMWPLLSDVVEHMLATHGLYHTLYLLGAYLTHMSLHPVKTLDLFYALLDNAIIEFNSISDTVKVYAVILIHWPPCSAAERALKRRIILVPWADIWLIGKKLYIYDYTNQRDVVDAVKSAVKCNTH